MYVMLRRLKNSSALIAQEYRRVEGGRDSAIVRVEAGVSRVCLYTLNISLKCNTFTALVKQNTSAGPALPSVHLLIPD